MGVGVGVCVHIHIHIHTYTHTHTHTNTQTHTHTHAHTGPKLPPVRTKEEIDKIYIQQDWATAMPFVKKVTFVLVSFMLVSLCLYQVSFTAILCLF